MALGLHNLQPTQGSKQKRTRVGRGHGSGIGAYSGRGIKGQRARSGGRNNLKLKGIKQAMQALPKLGGFTSMYTRLAIVNLHDLEKHFPNKAVITNASLVEKGLVPSVKNGIKLLGEGTLTKSFTIKVNRASASAIEAVKKAGGAVYLSAAYKRPKKKAE